MKQLKIKDNHSLNREIFYQIPSIVHTIKDKTLDQLAEEGVFVFPDSISESEDLEGKQMVLQSCNNNYISGNIMGFLGLGDEQLIIESRFSHNEKDYFFQYLLEKVMDFPNFVNLENNTDFDNTIFNFLIFLFPKYLSNAMRKGLYKTYINKQYNNSNVHGTIDVARHIKTNIPFTGNISYSRREYSTDNFLIELLRHTIEYIKSLPNGSRVLKNVKSEVQTIVDATQNYNPADKRKVIENNKNHTIKHAFYYEYSTLQKLCILILSKQKHMFGEGTKKIYGILFDGAWLWEEYVNKLISEWFYHPKNKTSEGVQKLFVNNIGSIFPDFISKQTENRIIADAKYKPFSNIGGKDYLQVLAYMLRFDAKVGYYLYPESEKNTPLQLFLNSGSSYEQNVVPRKDIFIIKHGFEIPENTDNYSIFSENMEKNEIQFIEGIQNT